VSSLTLVIGNKNYSSWSLRPWMALTMAGIPFNEIVIPLEQPDTKEKISAHSAAGRVPVLRHGRTIIWDSMAIIEYVAELFPEKNLWPKLIAARAMARSACAEMHSGFFALRNACPMNLKRGRKPVPMSDAVTADVARLESLWTDCRARFARGGKFLFGKFSAADAMFAPIVTRFDTYDVPVSDSTRSYMDAVMATPAFLSWKDAALKENWIVPSDEVD